MDRILNIYIIEDDIQRLELMKRQFDNYQSSPKSELMTFLQGKEIEKIQYHVVEAETTADDEKNYNYVFNEKLKKQLEEILEKEESRVFLLDLALDDSERDIFKRNSRIFYPHIANGIIELLGNSHQCEMIIINTRLHNLEDKINQYIIQKNQVRENLIISYIRAETFAKNKTWNQRDIILCDAIKDLWKKKEGR